MRTTSDKLWGYQVQTFLYRLFGGLLLLSVVLKVAGSGDASLVSSKQPLTGVSVLLVGAELLTGFWFLSGFAPRAGRIVAVLLLVVCFGVNVSGAYRGLSTCGCFGDVRVRPEYVAAVEAVYVVALFWLPVRAVWTAADGHALWTAGLSSFLVGGYLGAGYRATGQWSPDWYTAGEDVQFRHPLPLHDPHTATTLELTWTNDDTEPVQLTHLVSSCGCMQARTLPVWVAPREMVCVPVVFTTPSKPGEYRRNFAIKTSRTTLLGFVAGHVRDVAVTRSTAR